MGVVHGVDQDETSLVGEPGAHVVGIEMEAGARWCAAEARRTAYVQPWTVRCAAPSTPLCSAIPVHVYGRSMSSGRLQRS